MKTKIFIPADLLNLAELFPSDSPLYIVGGYVRCGLMGLEYGDLDLTSRLTPNELKSLLSDTPFKIVDSNLRVGTVIIKSKNFTAEYTTFRVDSYPTGGNHSPSKVVFTNDIALDARRRDFKINAIYYDVLKDEIIDPVGGLKDLNDSVLSTTRTPEEVFAEDGLRILRLVRFAAELNFNIDSETFSVAKELVNQILDLSEERIAVELKKILTADCRYRIKNNEFAHFKGVKLLDDVGALCLIFPPLQDGKGLKQNPKYHDYDVFEHSLTTVKFATADIRLAALLHDVAKPFCLKRDGNMYAHPSEGGIMARRLLGKKGLKLSNKEIDFTARLIENHMYNLDNQTKDGKLKVFIAKNCDIIKPLVNLMRADAMAAKGFHSYSADRIESLYDSMINSSTPMKISDLKVKGNDLISLNVPPSSRSAVMNKTLENCIKNNLNDYENQFKEMKKIVKEMIK